MEALIPAVWKKTPEGYEIDFHDKDVLVGRLTLHDDITYQMFSKDEQHAEMFYFGPHAPPLGAYILRDGSYTMPIRPLDVEEVRNFLVILDISLHGHMPPDAKESIVKAITNIRDSLLATLKTLEEKKRDARHEKNPLKEAALFVEISKLLGFERVGRMHSHIEKIFDQLNMKGEATIEDEDLNEFFYARIVKGDRYLAELEDAFHIKFEFDPESFTFKITRKQRR